MHPASSISSSLDGEPQQDGGQPELAPWGAKLDAKTTPCPLPRLLRIKPCLLPSFFLFRPKIWAQWVTLAWWMQLRRASGLYHIGLVEASRGIQASGPIRSMVIVAFWQSSQSLFSHGIQSWHEHPLLARASTFGSSFSIFFRLQHPFHVHVFSAMDVLLDPLLPLPGRSQIREA